MWELKKRIDYCILWFTYFCVVAGIFAQSAVMIPAMFVFLQPLGLAGAALMAVSSAATYIMWRYRSLEAEAEPTPSVGAQPPPRKSIFI
jgi:hypothetical protein